MKAIIEFDLTEEREEFEETISAPRMRNCLWEMDQWLRSQYKYMGDEEYGDEKYDTFLKCIEKLLEILNENNISL